MKALALLLGLWAPLCGCTAIAARPAKFDPATQWTQDADAPVPAGLAERIEAIRLRRGIPGVGFAVIRHGKISFAGVMGYRAADHDTPVALTDRFELSSNSKAMLAAVAAILVQEGKLSWDITVYDRIHDSIPGLSPAWRRITLRKLLTQTTGLSDSLWTMLMLGQESFADPRAGRLAFARRVLDAPPPGPASFSYQNTNYLLAAAIIEQAGDAAIEEIEREKLFVPLGMGSAGFGAPGRPGALDQPQGHGGRSILHYPLPWLLGERRYDPGAAEADVPRWLDPVGLAHADIGDWARFVAFILKSHPANPERKPGLLRAETADALFAPDAGDSSYAAGWYRTSRTWARAAPSGAGTVLMHQGDNAKWSSAAYVAPETGFAILLVCNRSGMADGLDEIAQDLVARFAAP